MSNPIKNHNLPSEFNNELIIDDLTIKIGQQGPHPITCTISRDEQMELMESGFSREDIIEIYSIPYRDPLCDA